MQRVHRQPVRDAPRRRPLRQDRRLVRPPSPLLTKGSLALGLTLAVHSRNGIKALNWFTEQREKMDDPAYSGWFMPFHAYPNGGWQKNHTYTVSPCTDGKCSGLWHDQTQTPEHHKLGDAELRVEGKPHYDNGVCVDECDCGLQPCGE